jgi:urease gamma subunit
MVVYCTGTRPRTTDLPLSIDRLTVETALSPSRLALLLPREEARTVAVVGSGHAAVLVLRNLFRMAAISHRRLRIRWFTRTERLTYAEKDPYYDDEEWLGEVPGVGEEAVVERRITNEHTGLLGEAAWFARTQLEGDKLEKSDAGAFIKRFVLPAGEKGMEEKEREAMEHEWMAREGHLEGVDHMVECIGWERARLPEVRPGLGPFRGPIGKPKRLIFNALTGTFFPSGGRRDQVVGLFGAGSAFPELVPTTKGWREPAISVWNFMRFVKKMVPRWVEATKRGYLMKGGDGFEAEGRRRFHQYY